MSTYKRTPVTREEAQVLRDMGVTIWAKGTDLYGRPAVHEYYYLTADRSEESWQIFLSKCETLYVSDEPEEG